MKKVIFLLAAFAVLSSCSKKEEQTPQFKEEGGKIQYPVGYMKEKIDNVDNPKIYSINILVDLEKKEKAVTKDVLVSTYIFDIRFKISTWDHNSFRYSSPVYCDGYNNDPSFSDLNEGAGGRYIYFYYTTIDNRDLAISQFWVTTMYDSRKEPGTLTDGDTPIPTDQYADLNDGAGGLYVFAHALKDPGIYLKMKGLGTISGNSSAIQPPSGWEKINVDLNRGAGGPYIYFIVKWGY